MGSSVALRVFVAAASIALSYISVKLISKGRLQLRYSLLWLLFALLVVVAAIAPEPLFAMASLAGFEQPSNFIFAIGLFGILAIIMSLTVVVSRLSRYVSFLVQDNALLRKRLSEMQAQGAIEQTSQ